MPRRTNSFQRLVALLTATLAGRAEVAESAMLIDRVNGEHREVDILVKAEAGGYTVQLGIEVISWARPADTPWIEKMRAKHENLPTDKLVLVSENGFYEPARRKAAFYGIELLTLEEANAADWELIAKLTATGVFEVMSISFDVAGILQLDAGARENISIPVTASFSTPQGLVTVDQLVRSILARQDVRDALRQKTRPDEPHDFWLSYSRPHGLWRYEESGKVGQIVDLRVGLKVVNSASPVRFAVGKFKAAPFVSGIATSGKPIQFVLARTPDGRSSGYLIDEAGVRSLSSVDEAK